VSVRRVIEKPEPEGPELRGEQVSEFWVWASFAVDERRSAVPPPGVMSDVLAWELDEAERLRVAFDRAIGTRLGIHDWTTDRFVRDQDPLCTARLSHYLRTRLAQWTARLGTDTEPEARARLRVAQGASALFYSLLGVSAAEMCVVCERLEIGERWPHSTVFRLNTMFDVVLETPEDGPVPAQEAERRLEVCRAAFRSKGDRPKRRRALGGGNP